MGDHVVTSEIDTVLAFLKKWKSVEIEIGSGNGHFLTTYGRRVQASGLLGVESKSKRCRKIEKKISTTQLSHILVYRGRVENLLAYLSSRSVDVFHIYFPDPWPKMKHRRRRLMRLPSIDVFHRLLKSGGLLYFGSDVFDYYLQVKVLAIHHGGFYLREDPLPSEAVYSLYSMKTEKAGKWLYSLVMAKKG